MATKKSNNQSILKKFLLINFVVFLIIGILTLFYLNTVKPTLIKNKTSSHIKIIDNTTQNIERLKINFTIDEIREFLFSTKFLFQSIDRVQIFDSEFNLLGDTDTLDLDPGAFSRSLNIIEMSDLNNRRINNDKLNENKKGFESIEIFDDLKKYSYSSDYGKPLTFSKENYDQFLLVTIKNVVSENETQGYLAITENANEIKVAIDERRNFITRTALLVALVILIFSYVLNRYFLKPIKNLVQYTNIIKNKSKEKTNIGNIKKGMTNLENYQVLLMK